MSNLLVLTPTYTLHSVYQAFGLTGNTLQVGSINCWFWFCHEFCWLWEKQPYPLTPVMGSLFCTWNNENRHRAPKHKHLISKFKSIIHKIEMLGHVSIQNVWTFTASPQSWGPSGSSGNEYPPHCCHAQFERRWIPSPQSLSQFVGLWGNCICL